MSIESKTELIDRLFTRLHLRYGANWLAKWDGLAMGAVKADWLRTLAPFFEQHRAAVAYALENLPQWPPTADEFARLCRACPTRGQGFAALENKSGRRDPARLAALLAKATAAVSANNARAGLLERLEAREARGKLREPQRLQLEALRRGQFGDGGGELMGQFASIPSSEWPWVKKGQAPVSVDRGPA